MAEKDHLADPAFLIRRGQLRMTIRFETARFHVEYGPESLFQRVQQKMGEVTSLSLTGSHYRIRKRERNIPKEVLQRIEQFNHCEWELVACEVRTDKGKFVNSTWETIWDEQRYWITIGFNNFVQTVINKDSSGVGDIVKGGALYDFVDQTNRELLEDGVISERRERKLIVDNLLRTKTVVDG